MEAPLSTFTYRHSLNYILLYRWSKGGKREGRKEGGRKKKCGYLSVQQGRLHISFIKGRGQGLRKNGKSTMVVKR